MAGESHALSLFLLLHHPLTYTKTLDQLEDHSLPTSPSTSIMSTYNYSLFAVPVGWAMSMIPHCESGQCTPRAASS